jgi:hypothetical protein
MQTTTNYFAQARQDAKDMAVEFIDQIVTALYDEGQVSDDLFNDYPNGDAYHHETHVDKAYSLLEAATLLDQLAAYEETDNGLWEGLAPREAVSAQAAYTYGGAVLSMWSDLIDTLNNDGDVVEAVAKVGPLEDTFPRHEGIYEEIKAAVEKAIQEY